MPEHEEMLTLPSGEMVEPSPPSWGIGMPIHQPSSAIKQISVEKKPIGEGGDQLMSLVGTDVKGNRKRSGEGKGRIMRDTR